jgi:U3 small nucleolar RNA-associated protein 14
VPSTQKKRKRKRAETQQARETKPAADALANREQMELVARAFAGAGGADLADFEETKMLEVNKSLPTAKDAGAEVLPGWGGWAGDENNDDSSSNAKKKGRGGKQQTRPESAFAKAAREKLEAARAAAVSARRDAKLDHVIISARRAKMASDLTMASVPFPYVTADQWEKEVATPLMRERMTQAELEKAIRPRVATKRGEALQPLRLSAGAQAELAQLREARAARRGNIAVVKMRGDRAAKRDGSRRALLT